MTNIKVNIFGIKFANPIWTAAGPTGANAEMMLLAAKAGAGAVVAKTISRIPARVPIPNIASPFPGSLLNAEKWSELDYQRFIDVEFPAAQKGGVPLIASIGYTTEDLAMLADLLDKSKCVNALEFSIHYVDRDINHLKKMALALRENTSLPILAKLSPPLENITGLVTTLEPLVDGFVAINSVGPAFDFDIETLEPVLGSADGSGWLSGRAILPIGLHMVRTIASLTNKPVIGVGGIRSAVEVIKYIMAGASAVQICSAAILHGEQIYHRLAEQLAQWMSGHNYENLEQLRTTFQSHERKKLYFLGEGVQLYPQIIDVACTYCDLCVKSCMYGAISFDQKKFKLDPEKCVCCGLCTTVCTPRALKMAEA